MIFLQYIYFCPATIEYTRIHSVRKTIFQQMCIFLKRFPNHIRGLMKDTPIQVSAFRGEKKKKVTYFSE